MKSYRDLDIYTDSKRLGIEVHRYLVYAHAECDETLLLLDLLYETGFLIDEDAYQRIKADYILLSKRINKFTQWAENNL